MDTIDRFRHPAWGTTIATAVSYGIVLLVLFVLLFVLPYLVVSLAL